MINDRPYLEHIAESIAAIEDYVSGGREAFMRERLLQDAVIRNFEIIGEAAGRLSPNHRNAPSAPWSDLIAFRNRLIHGYRSVDLLLVWDVITNRLPALKLEVTRLLKELPGRPQSEPN